MTAAAKERPHGYTRYKLDGCRCYVCGYAASEYRANQIRQTQRGTWKPFTDAEPIRDHIRMLSEAGIGWKRVAALTGISSGSMSKLMFGVKSQGRPPSARVRVTTAEKILAVRAGIDAAADHALVDSIGTQRRLRALIRAGWPQSRLAEQLGMFPANFGTMLGYANVTAARARQVRDLYDRIQNRNPLEHGIGLQGRNRAVNQGIRHGWPLPAMWDDDALDDPAAIPDWTGECGTARGYTIHHRDRIPYCQPCRDALTAHVKELKAAREAA